MKNYKFYKENQKWFIDLPDYPSFKEDLEMVEGADSFLDILAEGNDVVHLTISLEYFEKSNKLEFIKLNDELGSGAFYILKEYNGIDFNLEIWLCDVVKWLFNEFPNCIYLYKN